MGIQPRLNRREIVCKAAVAYMRTETLTSLSWGDGALVSIGKLCGLEGHPLDVMRMVVSALAASKATFETCHIRAHDARGRSRIVRSFRLCRESPFS